MASFWLLVLFLSLSRLPATDCLPGLSKSQQQWIDSVRLNDVSIEWPNLSSQQLKDLFDNVEKINGESWPANFPYNQAVVVRYSAKNRTKAVFYDDCGDSAAWTGLYLAAMAHKYNVTSNSTVLADVTKILTKIAAMIQCTGKKGYIPRIVGIAGDPPFYAYYNGGRYFPCVAPFQQYIWLGDTSRDMYLGIAFGLANVWTFVSDLKVKEATKLIVETIVDDLIGEHFWIVSPEKKITNPVPGFSAVYRKLAMTVNPTKYSHQKAGYEEDFLLQVLSDGFALHADKWASGYFSNELCVEVLYILSILEEDDPNKVETLFKAFTKVAVNNSDHYQPGYAAFYLSAFPNSKEYSIPKGVLQGGLYDYPAAPDWSRYVDLTTDPQYLPHKDGDHSLFAINIRDRPPDTYQWQRAPTTLKGGDTGAVQNPHIDLILPYWMGKSSGYL